MRQFNMFEFPLLEILDLLNVPCNPDGAIGLDFAASSEEIPGWDKPELANYMNPETAVFANPTAMLALPVSCALASSGLTPQTDDLMFWAMGCWGTPSRSTASAANPTRCRIPHSCSPGLC